VGLESGLGRDYIKIICLCRESNPGRLDCSRHQPILTELPQFLIIFSNGYKLWSSLLCSFLQPPVTSSFYIYSPQRPILKHPQSVRFQVLTAASMKFRVSWDVLPSSQVTLTDVSEVCTTSIIALVMEAVRTSETSVNIYLTTRQYIPEDSKLPPQSVFFR
jgi:hypothetical protein